LPENPGPDDLLPLLAALPQGRRAAFARRWPMRTLPAGATAALDPGEAAAVFVLSGSLRAAALSGADGGLSVETLEGPRWYRLAEAVAEAPVAGASLMADEPARICVVPGRELRDLMVTSGKAAFAVARSLAETVRPGRAGSEPLALVFRELLRRAAPAGAGRWSIDPLPRHRDLASVCGVSEDDAARAIVALIGEGAGRRRWPALDILDRERLAFLAG